MKRLGIAGLLLATACSPSSSDDTTGIDAPVVDGAARDGAAYEACFDPEGGPLPSYKACATNAECTKVGIPFCCGIQPVIGVNSASAAALAACILAWPGCSPDLSCTVLPGQIGEDGKITDASTAQVACVAPEAGLDAAADASPESGTAPGMECRTFIP
jgi:hypothetical protein